MVRREVRESVVAYLEALAEESLEVSFAVVFGSYAQGTSDSDSNIDLVVVSPLFDMGRQRAQLILLWRVATLFAPPCLTVASYDQSPMDFGKNYAASGG